MGMRTALSELTVEQKDTFSLVLASSGVVHQSHLAATGWELWVDELDHLRALRAIDRFLEENQPDSRSARPLPRYVLSTSGMLVAASMAAVHLASLTLLARRTLIASCGARADAILGGELDRTVTALFLHGDVAHLLGNMVGLILFGGAVAALWGAGAGWALVLATGALGNLLNALLHQQGHNSIGASTAVFGAIGLLAVTNALARHRDRRERLRAWLPLAAGFALLGLLGSSEKTDVTAHLFGFGMGLVLALLWRQLGSRVRTASRQAMLATGACLVVALAWMLGLFRLLAG
ncbi:MAG: rhomboid family intramembrane serine protease [Pseudomonadota bacterium]